MTASAARPARRRAVPAPPGPLVGRAEELAALGRRLTDPDIRLVTLTGPPGVGKTRLALAAAAAVAGEFPDGVAFVDLTTVRQADLVLPEITAALGQDGELDTGARLLVLDNFEHVLPAADAVGDLLATSPAVTAVVTSRERLHLRPEREVPVTPLALPGTDDVADPERLAATPAVRLLVGQVQAFDPAFTVTAGNAKALAELCVRLDGLPLALELAAARLRLFSLEELLFRLRHRVSGLASDARDVPDRHRTLTSALTWSHDLLGSDERAMFHRLSVFVGGWDLAAAERVGAVPDPLATTASLVDKSLVRRTGDVGGVARFGMLESLREFAAEQLDRTGESAATRDRHAEHFAEVAQRIEGAVGTGDERTSIEAVGYDVGNLRQALGHLLDGERPARGLPVAAALGWYCYTRGQLGEGQAILERAVAAAARAPDVPDETMASALIMVGTMALARGDHTTAERELGRGLEVNERAGSVRLRAIGTAFQGHLARSCGRTEEAVARHTEAGRLHARMGNLQGVAWSRYDLGLLARRRKDTSAADDHLRSALATFRDLGYGWAVGCCAWALATVDLARGRPDEAASLLTEALGCFEATDDFRGIAQCLEATAAVACAHGAPAVAARLLGAAVRLRAQLAAPLPGEEQGPRGAVDRQVRGSLGATGADEATRAGHAMPIGAVLDLARTVLSPHPGGRTSAADEGAALTPRERQVAELVRQGGTNRQIGRRLGISEKTIEVHVHHIIRKLGAESRAGIAAWVAAREGSGAR